MPASEALRIYRAKDAIEKLFHSLKSEIEVKPVRVWSKDAVHGVLLFGFIAQMMISLTRYFVEPLNGCQRNSSRLSAKVDGYAGFGGKQHQRRFYSKFNPINKAIWPSICQRLVKNAINRGVFDEGWGASISCVKF
jgi:transposase